MASSPDSPRKVPAPPVLAPRPGPPPKPTRSRTPTLLFGRAPTLPAEEPAAEELPAEELPEEEEDITIRVRVEDSGAPSTSVVENPIPIPVPPPLPAMPSAGELAPLVAMEAKANLAPLVAMEGPAKLTPYFAMEAPATMESPRPFARFAAVGAVLERLGPRARASFAAVRPVLERLAPKTRSARIGYGIFAAGVLVGVLGAAVVMNDGDAPVAGAAAPGASPVAVSKPVPLALAAPKPAALAVATPKPAPPATPSPPAIEKAAEPADAPEADTKSHAGRQGEDSARDAVILPVSSSSAPTCREVLGESAAKKKDPRAAQRETRLANRELVLGNVPAAQRAYCTAFALDRTNIDRHVNLGRFYLFRRDWDKAAEYGQSALKLDPKNARALGVVGDAWAALDKTSKARTAWLAAEKKTKASKRELDLMARRNFALAKRVERMKDFSLAERLYRRVLLLDPKHAGAMKGIAGCLLKVGDYQGAEAWARRADMLKRTR